MNGPNEAAKVPRTPKADGTKAEATVASWRSVLLELLVIANVRIFI